MLAVRIVNREGEFYRRGFATEGRDQLQVSIDRVLVWAADVDAMGVEDRGELACAGEPDAHRSAGMPGEPAAAEQALEIQDEIEVALSQGGSETRQAK